MFFRQICLILFDWRTFLQRAWILSLCFLYVKNKFFFFIFFLQIVVLFFNLKNLATLFLQFPWSCIIIHWFSMLRSRNLCWEAGTCAEKPELVLRSRNLCWEAGALISNLVSCIAPMTEQCFLDVGLNFSSHLISFWATLRHYLFLHTGNF